MADLIRPISAYKAGGYRNKLPEQSADDHTLWTWRCPLNLRTRTSWRSMLRTFFHVRRQLIEPILGLRELSKRVHSMSYLRRCQAKFDMPKRKGSARRGGNQFWEESDPGPELGHAEIATHSQVDSDDDTGSGFAEGANAAAQLPFRCCIAQPHGIVSDMTVSQACWQVRKHHLGKH